MKLMNNTLMHPYPPYKERSIQEILLFCLYFALLSLCRSGHLRFYIQNCDTRIVFVLVRFAIRPDERQRLLNISTSKLQRENVVIV
jgi:hypothetical protein